MADHGSGDRDVGRPDDLLADDAVLMSYEAAPRALRVEATGAPAAHPEHGQDAAPGPDTTVFDPGATAVAPAAPDTPPSGAVTPIDTAPTDTTPTDTAPTDTAPTDTAPTDTAPTAVAPSAIPATAVPPIAVAPIPAAPATRPPGTGEVTPAETAPRTTGRRRRQSVTFAGLLGAVLVLGLFSAAVTTGMWSWPFGGGSSGTASPSLSCTAAPMVQAARLTKVRVYNATVRRGLALSTARELRKRGFMVPEPPRNDPDESRPNSAAVVRHGPGGEVAARTIATQVKGAVVYQQDDRLGEIVDLVLGQAFALVDPVTGAAALKPAASPAPSCPPGG
ncbi:MAG TPA: LytR C-terminal domain-containing protein [Kineosporiaceae bacterium]